MIFPFKWYLKDGYPSKGIQKNNLNVFSTFACGGGSSMGYKLAGFNVLGANDIDPEMAKVYKENHNPELYYLCDIRELNKLIQNKEVDERLFDLDILDGSPPCSTFSLAGKREEGWNVDKIFREGQSKQRLDDLFFSFIETVKLLKPKVVIAENVKGLIFGNAKGYVLQIKEELIAAGYNVQLFLLNSATMNVPQKRERMFFICSRKDLCFPNIKLTFHEEPIKLNEILKIVRNQKGKELSNAYKKWYYLMVNKFGSFSLVHPKQSFFNTIKCDPNKVLNTITSTEAGILCHPYYPNKLSNEVLSLCGTFPIDYNYLNLKPRYLIGMSVPPVMMAQIAYQMFLQWFVVKNITNA